MALSNDQGLTFHHVRDLVDRTGFESFYIHLGEHSYPSMLLSEDGSAVECAWTHMRETVQHRTVPIEWFSGGDNLSEGEFHSRKEAQDQD